MVGLAMFRGNKGACLSQPAYDVWTVGEGSSIQATTDYSVLDVLF